MNTQDLLDRGGRIVRQRKGRRVITIAYQRKGDQIVYGATIFRKERPTEQWTRDGQRQIAIDRLVSAPVVVPVTREFEGLRDQDQYVRNCLLDHGCQSVPAVNRLKEAISQ